MSYKNQKIRDDSRIVKRSWLIMFELCTLRAWKRQNASLKRHRPSFTYCRVSGFASQGLFVLDWYPLEELQNLSGQLHLHSRLVVRASGSFCAGVCRSCIRVWCFGENTDQLLCDTMFATKECSSRRNGGGGGSLRCLTSARGSPTEKVWAHKNLGF
jgi:hypothetical protein